MIRIQPRICGLQMARPPRPRPWKRDCWADNMLSRRICPAAGRVENANRGGTTIKLDELRRTVAVVDPAAILVPARILRRAIKVDRGLNWLGGARPTCYVISAAALGAIVNGSELGRPPDAALPSIATPDRATGTRGAGEGRPWSRPDRDLATAVSRASRPSSDGRSNPGRSTAPSSARIEAIGRTEFEEARDTLRQDGLLLPPVSDRSAYTVFASVFLELTSFEPSARSSIFPAIECPADVETVLARDLDAGALLTGTRPAGALRRRRRSRRKTGWNLHSMRPSSRCGPGDAPDSGIDSESWPPGRGRPPSAGIPSGRRSSGRDRRGEPARRRARPSVPRLGRRSVGSRCECRRRYSSRRERPASGSRR